MYKVCFRSAARPPDQQMSRHESAVTRSGPVSGQDLDFKADGRKLHLAERAGAASEALRRDIALLQRLRLIDYSLLAGDSRGKSRPEARA